MIQKDSLICRAGVYIIGSKDGEGFITEKILSLLKGSHF